MTRDQQRPDEPISLFPRVAQQADRQQKDVPNASFYLTMCQVLPILARSGRAVARLPCAKLERVRFSAPSHSLRALARATPPRQGRIVRCGNMRVAHVATPHYSSSERRRREHVEDQHQESPPQVFID